MVGLSARNLFAFMQGRFKPVPTVLLVLEAVLMCDGQGEFSLAKIRRH